MPAGISPSYSAPPASRRLDSLLLKVVATPVLIGTASLAELLRQREFELLRPKLAPDRPLPYGINPLNVRFAVRGSR